MLSVVYASLRFSVLKGNLLLLEMNGAAGKGSSLGLENIITPSWKSVGLRGIGRGSREGQEEQGQ